MEISKEQLQQMYVDQGMTAQEIADACGLSKTTVQGRISLWKIKRPSSPHKDPAVLREMYINRNMSQSAIAQELGISEQTIRVYLGKYGIEKPNELIRKCQEQTMVDKYGCVNPSQNEEVKKKKRETAIKHYGVENPIKSDVVQEKIRATNRERYGVDYHTQSEEVKDKIRKTNIERFGCENPFMNEEIRESIKNTSSEKYGSKYAVQSKAVKDKIRQTNIERYGHPCALQNPDVQQKKINTCEEKYGCKYPLQNQEILQKALDTTQQRYGIRNVMQKHLSDKAKQAMASRAKLRKFMKDNNIRTTTDLSSQLGCSLVTAERILHKFHLWKSISHQESAVENEVTKFVRSLGIKCYRDRAILNPLEIDCYCPDYKIGIEFNGIYWHSSLHKARNYHYNKSLEAEKQGVRLIHIYENEWADPRMRPIIESLLRLSFGKVNKKIYARKCEIREISNAEARFFLNENHLQGYRSAKITLGLFYNDALVQIMSFSHHHKYEWEIIRSCPKLNTIVVGAVSKLFSYFVEKYNPNTVFSYADFNKFDGKGYSSIGMKHIGYTGPDMKWVINGVVYNRKPTKNKEMKSKAEAQLWGSGSKKFLWEKKYAET